MNPNEEWKGPFYSLMRGGYVASIAPEGRDGRNVTAWEWTVAHVSGIPDNPSAARATPKAGGKCKSLKDAMWTAEQALGLLKR